MNKSQKQLDEHRAREQFQRKLEQLRFELRVESPRRVLDYLIEHLEDILPRVGDNLLGVSFGEQLERARRLVSGRHNLRVVGEVKPTRWSEQPKRMLRQKAIERALLGDPESA
jgi:hypothetical protein